MREIKFRCWNKEQKCWAKMNLADWGSWQGAPMSQNYPKDQPEEFEHVNNERYEWVQFTGLKDKNGREIYEGDIVKYDEGDDINHWLAGETAVVLSLPGRFTARMTPYDKFTGANQNTLNEDFGPHIEVIGNIWENPELISKEV